jgi:UPF0755 protein
MKLKSILIIVFSGLIIVSSYKYFLYKKNYLAAQTKMIMIPKGSNFNDVLRILEENKITNKPYLIKFYAEIWGITEEIKSGEYQITSPTSIHQILTLLSQGKIYYHKITIKEGDNIFDIANMLSKNNLVDKEKFLELCFDQDFLEEIGIKSISVEGYLFPETYFISKTMDQVEIINMMVGQFKKNIKSEYLERARELGFSMHEIIIMASLIEKESSVYDFEKPIVASVFHNRIKRGMRLQSDPSVIYGISNFNGNITKKDLLRKTPYNTYAIYGLPLGPIANPGLSSIKATLYPAKSEYLYFVSKNDGKHYFSRNYEEHLQAVRLYQLTQKAKE